MKTAIIEINTNTTRRNVDDIGLWVVSILSVLFALWTLS